MNRFPALLLVPLALVAGVQAAHAEAISNALLGAATGITSGAGSVAAAIVTLVFSAIASLALPLLPSARG